MKKFVIVFLSFSALTHMLAQTGPAGVGTAANNVLWTKGDVEVYNDAGVTLATNGNNVQRWNDMSGNSDHANQTVLANRPNYVTSVINSLPVIRYTAANNDLLMSTTVGTGNAASVWAVASYATLPSSNPGIFQGAPAGSGSSVGAGDKSIGMWVTNAVGTRVWGRGIQSNNTQQQISQVTTLSMNTFYIINNMYNGVASINQFVNNAAAGNVAYNGTLKSWADVSIGRQGTESWNGDIAEVIAFNIALNSAQRNIVDNYLSAKYDIALSSNDKYAGDISGNGSYDYEVAGVGIETTGSNPSFSASICGGLGISTTGTGFDNTDYILAGHATTTNSQVSTDVGGMTGTNNARWHRIWYVDITNTGTNIQANVEFDMSDGDVGAVTLGVNTDYVLLYRAAQTGNWTELTTATSVVGDRVLFNAFSFVNDGYYTIGTKNSVNSPLPIELLSFDAIKNDNKVDINWKTASETMNDYFTLERSKDGISFETVSIIKGSSNSKNLIEYSETDFNPLDGISYYRLKQTDLNGQYSYSKIVAVNYHFGDIGMDVYPNPSNGDFKINVSNIENQEVLVLVKDITGKECFSKVILTNRNEELIAVDLEGKLVPGTYLVLASSVNKLYSKKIIVK